MQKKVSKNNRKKLKKTRQLSKADISDFKLECTKMFLMKCCYHGLNFIRKFQTVLKYTFIESDKNTPPSPLLSKDEGLRDIGHNISIRNLILVASSVTVSYLIHHDSLLQNATDIITKSDSYLITKCGRSYYKMRQDFYYKLRRFHYKMRQLLQNARFIINCSSTYILDTSPRNDFFCIYVHYLTI